MKQGDAEWLDTRSKCAITWSEAANALGIGYDSRQAYMKRKLGITPPKEPNWRMLEGQKRENWVCELYFRIMGAFWQPVDLWVDAFRFDPQDRRLGGSVDRLVTDRKTGEQWVLECKTVRLSFLPERGEHVAHFVEVVAAAAEIDGIERLVQFATQLSVFSS